MQWKISLLLGAIISAILWTWHYTDKKKAVDIANLKQKVVQLQTSVDIWKKTVEVESYMRESLQESLGVLNEEYNSITIALNESNSLLQQYKTKPNRDTKPTSSSCTRGAPELYREDANFLIGEAGRAERVLKERDFYYERYEFARKQLEAFKRAASG